MYVGVRPQFVWAWPSPSSKLEQRWDCRELSAIVDVGTRGVRAACSSANLGRPPIESARVHSVEADARHVLVARRVQLVLGPRRVAELRDGELRLRFDLERMHPILTGEERLEARELLMILLEMNVA